MPIPQLSQNKYQRSWKDKQDRSSRSPYKKKRVFLGRLIFNKKIWIALLVVIVIFIISGLGMVAWMSRNLPNPNNLIDRDVAQTTKIYDRTGETLLYKIHGRQQRTLKTLEQIPDHMEHATIAMEDKNFYQHSGFSLWAIFRTAITDIIYEEKAGGSTITQQLIKNTILTSKKTIPRKIKELILAYQLEQKYSKDEILQMYLNEIPYGGTTYGVEAASQYYFNKSVENITLGEAATLAALPQAPSYYSPYGPHKELLIERKNYILKLMCQQGYISQQEMKKAQNKELTFNTPSSDIKAPHFVMYIKSILSRKYGQKMLEQGGLKIYTTLDMYKQKIAQKVVKKKAKINEKKYNATNAGLVSIDPKTGQVLAMVGSRGYFNDEIDGKFNVTTAKRQPGSSMKPIIYSALFEKGFTPKTQLFDVITNFSNNPKESYIPKNYSLKEHGLISLRKSLAASLNIPAVKSLYLAGMDNVFNLIQKMGYSTFNDRTRFGLSLVLGGGEVKLLEHTNAYSTFAREGIIHPISPILKIKNSQGEIIEKYQNRQKRVIKARTARMINSVLSDNKARAMTYGLDNWLTLDNRPVAAKTGTTNSYRDAWIIGYTPSLVAGVWVGNNNNTKMKRGVAGGIVAAPIWHQYMKKVLGDTPVEKFKKLKGVKTGKPAIDGEVDFKKTVKIDKASSLLATKYTPKSYIKEKTYTTKPHCILYYVNKQNPLGPKPKNSSQDPQFNNWEKAIQKWVKENNKYSTSSQKIPTKKDNVHKPEYQPELTITSPSNKVIITNSNLKVKTKISAPRGVAKVNYYINDKLWKQKTSFPFNLGAEIGFLSNGYHRIKVEVCDDVDNCVQKNILINLKLKNNNNNYKDMDVSWNSPGNGVILNQVDFPFNLKAKITPIDQVSKIKVISKLTSTSTSKSLIKTITNPNKFLNTEWQQPSRPGTYDIILKIHTWDGRTRTSKPLTEIVNITPG